MHSDYYTGNVVNLKRHGFGTYVYKNKYFTYEGEWKNGKKHGHGRLTMCDGSYFDGDFQNGEISGKGCRWQAGPGNMYEGEFFLGECNGKGIMKYSDGSIYDGEWVDNRRQGYGILSCDLNKYEGCFYNNKRHDEGQQLYSDGSCYTGNWVCDLAQGHGIMFYPDGSIYEGQWLQGARNGEGVLNHSSGMRYEGLWSLNFPLQSAHKLLFKVNEAYTCVAADETFDICVMSVDGNGKLCLYDDGREILIFASKLLESETISDENVSETIISDKESNHMNDNSMTNQIKSNINENNNDDDEDNYDDTNTNTLENVKDSKSDDTCACKFLDYEAFKLNKFVMKSNPKRPISFEEMRAAHINLCICKVHLSQLEDFKSSYMTPFGLAQRCCQLTNLSKSFEVKEESESVKSSENITLQSEQDENENKIDSYDKNSQIIDNVIQEENSKSKISQNILENLDVNPTHSSINVTDDFNKLSSNVEENLDDKWLPVTSLYIRNGCLTIKNARLKNVDLFDEKEKEDFKDSILTEQDSIDDNITTEYKSSNGDTLSDTLAEKSESISNNVPPGEYVLTAYDITRPPFLGYYLEAAFTKITIT